MSPQGISILFKSEFEILNNFSVVINLLNSALQNYVPNLLKNLTRVNSYSFKALILFVLVSNSNSN